jgi:hypothetical protein
MLAGGKAVTKQHFIAAIGGHRSAVILGAVTGKFATMTIDPDGALGRLRIGTNIKGKRRHRKDDTGQNSADQMTHVISVLLFRFSRGSTA